MQISLRDTGDLKRLHRALGQVAGGKELRRELSQGLRGVLRPYVPRVQAAYRAIPEYKGRRSRSRAQQRDLSDLLARSVRVEVRLTGKQAGARIRADGRRMPDGFKSLPRLVEGEGHEVDRRAGRWRHPVFGNREVWVQQQPFPTFYRVLRPTEGQARREVGHVIARIVQELERRT